MSLSYSLTQIANAAAQRLVIIDSGGSLSTQQLTDALAYVNNLLDSWSSQRLYAIQAVVTNFVLTAGVSSYGTAAVFGSRPVAIESAGASFSGFAGEVKIVDGVTFLSDPDRQNTGPLPKRMFYDRGYPNGNIYLEPIPGNAATLTLYTWTALTAFADKTTPITFPPAYARLVTAGVALEMASQFSITPSAGLIQEFSDASAAVRQLNSELLGPEPPAGQIAAPAAQPIVSPSGAPGGPQ